MEVMTEDRALALLRPERVPKDLTAPARYEFVGIDADGSWAPEQGFACLDGTFTVEELEAIAWWMRNKQSEPAEAQSPRSRGAVADIVDDGSDIAGYGDTDYKF